MYRYNPEVKKLKEYIKSGAQQGMFAPLTTTVREALSMDWNADAEKIHCEIFDRYQSMYLAFASYVRKECENPFDYEYERRLHKLVLRSCGVDV